MRNVSLIAAIAVSCLAMSAANASFAEPNVHDASPAGHTRTIGSLVTTFDPSVQTVNTGADNLDNVAIGRWPVVNGDTWKAAGQFCRSLDIPGEMMLRCKRGESDFLKANPEAGMIDNGRPSTAS
jgi:hypothetical protein